MKAIRLRTLLLNTAVLAAAFGAVTLRAADGSWNVDADGNWGDSANWLNNIVPSDPDSTAYFTNDITYFHTVTLQVARTNGNLVFGDGEIVTTPGGWILTGSGLTLTNSSAVPVITVSNINEVAGYYDSTNDAIVSSIITSPQGFIKNGPGTLTLSGANVLGASAQLNEGIVAIGNSSALGGGNRAVNFNGGGVRFWNGGPAYANTNIVPVLGILVSSNGNYDGVNGQWIGSGTVQIHSTGRLTIGGGSATAFSQFTGTLDLTDTTSGNETRINLGSGSTPYNLSTVTLNTGTNGGRFDFRASVAPARVRIGALTGGSGTRLDSSEQSAGTSLFWEIGYLNTSTTFAGTIRNRNGDATRVGHLVKVGTGTLTLTGNSTYTGNTIISNGVLALADSATLGSTPSITIHGPGVFDVSGLLSPFSLWSDTETLAGSGVVTGAVNITMGTVSPGLSLGNIGTLTFKGDLTLDGSSLLTTNVLEIGAGVNDQIMVNGNLTLGGTVVLQLIPTGPTLPNGTYDLIKWTGTLTGDQSNLQLSYAPQPGTIALSVNTSTKTISVQVSGATVTDLTWRGDGSANAWDVTTTPNWLKSGSPSVFNNGDNVTFNDFGSNNVPVDIMGTVNPGIVLFTNVTKNYEVSSTSGGFISGSAEIHKKGAATVTLATDNNNTGDTFISEGVLQIGNGGSSGALGIGTVSNGATLMFNRDVAANNGLIKGPGKVVQTGFGALTLSGANTYTGGTVVSNGILYIGNATSLGSGTLTLAGGAASAGSLAIANPISIVADSTIENTSGETQLTSDSISGASGKTLTLNGSTMRFTGSGFSLNSDIALNLSGANGLRSYNQFGTQIFNGVISGSSAYQRRWPSSDLANTGTTIFNGANTYSGGTLLREGSIGFGSSTVSSFPGVVDSGPIGTQTMTQDSGTIYTAVFASGGPRTVANPITLSSGGAPFTIKGSDDLTLSGTMDLGGLDKTLAIENTAKTILSGDISNGNLIKTGDGALYINGNNYATATTVTAGTLGGTGSFFGPVTMELGSTLAPGASVGTMNITGDLSIGGNVAIEVNKSLTQSNDYVTVTGVLTNTGTGTLTVANLGPALAVGDTFTLFSQPVKNGAALTVTGGGATWVNHLASDGSISVQSLGKPTLNVTQIGNSLQFTWTGSYKLQAQTNSLNVGLSSNWGDYPGGGASGVNVPIDTTQGAVFFRLISTP